jgi:hypothetical protein
MSINSYFRPGWVIAGFAAVASLILALMPSIAIFSLTHKQFGKYIVFFWVLIPPIWFWLEWNSAASRNKKNDREWKTHAHDLGRNFWLAITLMLTYLFDIKLPGIG